MPDLAKAEIQTEHAINLRRDIGIPSDGYAHVHVDSTTHATVNVYVVLPGGCMMSVGDDANELTLRRRADFIVEAINERLSPLPPRPLPHQGH